MIYNSEYWKDDLIKVSKRLMKAKLPKTWSDRDFGNFEKDIMLGFYSIRKLKESGKLSNTTFSTKVQMKKFKFKDDCRIDRFKTSDYEELYDFELPLIDYLDVSFFASQIIHSYVFFPFCRIDESNGDHILEAIHFNSDKTRRQFVYELSIDFVIELFKKAGNDYPSNAEVKFNPSKDDYDMKLT